MAILKKQFFEIWRKENTATYQPKPPPLSLSLSLSLSLVLFAENRKLDLVVPCDDAIAELSCQQRWPRTTAAAAVSLSLLFLLLLLIIIIIIMLCWGDEAPTVS